MPTLELASRAKQPLIVVADDIFGEALAALIVNAMRGSMKVAAIKAPSYGKDRFNTLQDMAIAVGATFISAQTGKTLTAQQKLMLRRWIQEGAVWQKHWSFEAPIQSPLPNVSQPDWVRQPFDTFILHRLEQAGLQPQPEADGPRVQRADHRAQPVEPQLGEPRRQEAEPLRLA